MALVVPYTSQVGIQTGNNPGPMARMRDAGGFMSHDDKMLAPALRDLSQGLGQLSEALHMEEVRKAKTVFDLTMQEEQLGLYDRMNQWIDNYKQNNQGVNTAGAQAAFEEWSKAEQDGFLQRHGGNDRARLFAANNMAPMILSGANNLRDYENQQLRAADMASYEAYQRILDQQMAANPGAAPGIIEQKLRNYDAMMSKLGAPAEAITLGREQLISGSVASSISSFLDADDPESAKRFIDEFGRTLGKTSGNTGAGFVNPLSGEMVITSEPGYRHVRGGSRDHGGYDFRAREGTQLRSSTGGIVTSVKSFRDGNGGGNRITVTTPEGYEIIYMHLGSMGVKVGQQVAAGDIIGTTGSSGKGKASGGYAPHLHMEMKINGQNVDYGEYLQGAAYKDGKKGGTNSARVTKAPSGLFGTGGQDTPGRGDATPAEERPIMLASLSSPGGDTATDMGGITPDSEADLVPLHGMETPAVDIDAIESGQDAPIGAPGTSRRPAYDSPDHPLAGKLPLREIKKLEDAIADGEDRVLVKGLSAELEAAFDGNSELDIATVYNQAVTAIDEAAAGDPERQQKLFISLDKQSEYLQKKRQAADGQATEEFYAAAANLSPMDQQKLLAGNEWRGKFSRARLAALNDQIGLGGLNKANPQNVAATQALTIEIDRRNNGVGGAEPFTEEELAAQAYAAGCTKAQVKELKEYRANGGLAGVDGFAGKVLNIYLEYKNIKGKTEAERKAMMPPGFLRMVAQHLQPGTQPSTAEVRRAVAEAMMSDIKGRTFYEQTAPSYNFEKRGDGLAAVNPGFASRTDQGGLITVTKSRRETAHEAMVKKEFGNFRPDVESWEKDRIDSALAAVRYEINDITRSLWKKAEIMGLDLTDAERDLIEKYRVW